MADERFKPTHEFKAMGQTFAVRVEGNLGHTSDGKTPWQREDEGAVWMYEGRKVDYCARRTAVLAS